MYSIFGSVAAYSIALTACNTPKEDSAALKLKDWRLASGSVASVDSVTGVVKSILNIEFGCTIVVSSAVNALSEPIMPIKKNPQMNKAIKVPIIAASNVFKNPFVIYYLLVVNLVYTNVYHKFSFGKFFVILRREKYDGKNTFGACSGCICCIHNGIQHTPL